MHVHESQSFIAKLARPALLLAALCAASAAWLALRQVAQVEGIDTLMRLPFSMAMLTLLCVLAQAAIEYKQRKIAIALSGAVAFLVTMTIGAWVGDLPPPLGLIMFSASHAATLPVDGTWFPSVEGVLASLPIAIGSVATLWLALNIGQQVARPLGWATGLILLLAPVVYALLAAYGAVATPILNPHLRFTPAAVLISAAIALYGFALIASLHTHLAEKIDPGARLRAIAVVLTVAGTLILWHTVRTAEIRQLQTDIDMATQAVENNLRDRWEELARAPSRLADHWGHLRLQVPAEVFRADSEIVFQDYPATDVLLLTDAHGKMINAVRRNRSFDDEPATHDAAMLIDRDHLPFALEFDGDVMRIARESIATNRRVNAAPVALPSGVLLSISAEPISDDSGRTFGSLVLAYRRDIRLKRILKDTAPNFEVRVRMDGVPIYRRPIYRNAETHDEAELAQQYSKTLLMTIGGIPTVVDVTPNATIVTRNLTWTPRLVLLSTWASLLLLIFALHNERRAHGLLQDRERVLNQSLDMICTLSADGRILTMNDASRRMLGYEPRDLCGRFLLDLVYASDRAAANREWLNKDLETPERTQATRFVRFDGNMVYLQGVARWAKDEQLLYFTIRDVTEHHKLEIAHRHAAKTLDTGVEQAGCVVYEYSPLTQRIQWVGAVQALTGFTPTEFADRGYEGWLQAIHPDDREHAHQTLQRCLETQQPHSIDYRLQRKDGSYVPVLDRGRYVVDEHHDPRMIGALIDLTVIRQQEQALRRSEERYRTIATQVGAVIMERDSITGRVEAHGPVEKVFGYTKAQIESRPVQPRDVMIHPDDRERVFQVTSEAARNLSTYYVEYRRRHRGGHYIYIANRGVILPGPDGKAERAVVAITDITARKQAEELLKQSEERFRLAVEQSKQIVYEFSYNDKLEIQSKRFAGAIEALSGFSDQEFAAVHELSHLALLHPDDVAIARAITPQMIDASGTYQVEHRLRRKDGSYVYVENRGTALRNSAGELIGTLGLLLDVSTRKAAEADRQRYTAQLHMLADVARKVSTLQSLYELVNYLARSMRELVAANAASASLHDASLVAERLVAVSYADHYGRQRGGAESFGSQELHDALTQSAAPMRLSASEIANDERWSKLSQNDDLPHPLRGWLAVSLTARNGEIIGVLEVSDKTDGDFTDSDAQVLSQLAGIASVAIENIRVYATLEERVTARTRELEMSNRELEAFSYSVSHDLRAPLRAIAGFGSILENEHAGKLDADARRYLQRIIGGAERMANLIDDLLSLARVSRLDLKHEAVDLTALCRAIVKRQLERFPDRAIDIKIQARMHLNADPRLMEVAMENLIENAIKFTGTRAQAQIQIGQRPANGQQAFFISDNGVGFDPQYAANLFGVFQRLHSNSEFPGTGVGLATVQRIIQRHHGRVWAEAQIDQGACFYFTVDSEI